MKCFNHDAVDAAATCKICSKALCHGCLTVEEGGVCCDAPKCIADLKGISSLIDHNVTSIAGISKRTLGTAIAFLVLGLIFLGVGVYRLLTNPGTTVVLSFGLAAFALYYSYICFAAGKNKKSG